MLKIAQKRVKYTELLEIRWIPGNAKKLSRKRQYETGILQISKHCSKNKLTYSNFTLSCSLPANKVTSSLPAHTEPY